MSVTGGPYPYRAQVRLAPTWSSRRSQVIAAACLLCAWAATRVGGAPTLERLDDLTLRVLLPSAMAFVLAFAPRPSTRVGMIAVDLTIAGLLVASFAGSAALPMLIGYPILLAAAVALDHLSGRPA